MFGMERFGKGNKKAMTPEQIEALAKEVEEAESVATVDSDTEPELNFSDERDDEMPLAA